MQKLPCLSVALLTLFGVAGADAAGQATQDEAKAMTIRAAEYLRAHDPVAAFAAFNAKYGPWHDRDLYVTVEDSEGVMVAHGTNAGLIGRTVVELKDVEGKPFNHEVQAVTDTGWVNYKWQNPLTKVSRQ